jgi:hypothetical protein
VSIYRPLTRGVHAAYASSPASRRTLSRSLHGSVAPLRANSIIRSAMTCFAPNAVFGSLSARNHPCRSAFYV